MPNKDQVVDWDGLVYYDTKIKQYINDKTTALETEINRVADLVSQSVPQETIDAFEQRVDTLEKMTAVQAAEIESLKEERDDLEEAVVVLEAEDKQLNRDIADLRVAVENLSADVDMSDFATKDYVQDELRELSASVTSDMQVLTDALAEIQSDLEDVATKADITELQTQMDVLNTTLTSEYITVTAATQLVQSEVSHALSEELETTVVNVVTEKINDGTIELVGNKIRYGEF